ncbi:ABC transporter permease subunit [Kyrpidia tusciae]|uniref:Binding-protein-dependent transport systems inner membrane component n=1 Tax=Kyrpidia tusciae (strain DSM 2912 / NBRC 15312 / T2) TaxID=562970 RepID=D5WWV9_KYRT2|nr:ABC transporter permease subunit [Kyrpidia tusciae]ADG05810.1 binding-protein-dependent transport systems inner membrane component [Kyrpidia tusciae DSM 2912]
MRTAATLAATVAAIFLLLPLFVLGISWMLRATVSTAVLAIVLRTAVAAAVATTIDMVFGIAMGYRLSRDPEFRRRPLRMLLQIPGHVPQAAVGLALVMAYGGVLGNGSSWTGYALVIAAMVFVSLPVAVEECRRGFDAVDIHLERVSRTLGAGAGKTFRQVTLPLAADGLLGAAAVVFARAFGEFAALAFFMPFPLTVGTGIYQWFSQGMTEKAVEMAAVGAMFSLLSWVLVVGIRLWVGRRLGRFRG